MAATVTIIEQPYPLDFAKNETEFILLSNKVSAQGHIPYFQYEITGLPSVGTDISLQFCGITLGFSVFSTAMAAGEAYRIGKYMSLNDIKSELDLKWGDNYYVKQYFGTTSVLVDTDNDNVPDTIRMTFTGKNAGDYDIVITEWSNAPSITETVRHTGTDLTYHDNFKIFAQYELKRISNGVMENITTPEMYFELGNDNHVHVPLTIPSTYLENIDIPTLMETFGAYKLDYLFLQYRLNYAVAKGQFAMLINIVNQTQFKRLFNGRMSADSRSLNEPDWNDSLGTSGSTLSNYAHVRSYGCGSGLRVKSFEAMYQFAYFIFNDENQSDSATKTITFSVDVLETDGTQLNNNTLGTLTLTNHSVVRVPLSHTALNISNISTKVLSYTVKASNTNSKTWQRTFIMYEEPYFAKVFLLQNKYGVLESFFIDNELMEHTIEGEEVIQGKRNAVSKTDIKTVFTARTGYKSEEEMSLLKCAVSETHHFKVVDGKLASITILPDTFTILDESIDLQSAEFRYIVNEDEENGFAESNDNWKDTDPNSGTIEKWKDAQIFVINDNRAVMSNT